MKYDIPEVAECGWMSEQHAKDFFAFIKADAERRGYDKGQQDGYAFCETKMDSVRQAALKEVLEIIEAKLKNDPNNPVLVMGLRYVEGIIKEKLAQ